MSATPRVYVKHNVRVSLDLLGRIHSALEHAIQYSDGGSEQNEIDLADWTQAFAEVGALSEEIRHKLEIEKLEAQNRRLLRSLTDLLKGEVDSQSNAVDLIQDLTGVVVIPNV